MLFSPSPRRKRLQLRISERRLLLMLGDALSVAAAVLIALGNGLMWPTFMAVLSRRAEGRIQGAVQGFASSLGAAASIVGLIAGGLLYTWLGAMAFAVPAVIIAGVALLALGARAPTSMASS